MFVLDANNMVIQVGDTVLVKLKRKNWPKEHWPAMYKRMNKRFLTVKTVSKEHIEFRERDAPFWVLSEDCEVWCKGLRRIR